MAEDLVHIRDDPDVITARQVGRELAARLKFNTIDLTFIATAISEIARNVVEYAGEGNVQLTLVEAKGRRGIEVVTTDEGPGIPDIPRVLRGGYSTGRSLGMGISGARRLMDEFRIQSAPGKGTTVTMRKWEHGPRAAGNAMGRGVR